jgi:SAM-dependent methyltransferase
VHRAAARGFEIGAEVYERARPSYPAEAVDAVVADLRLPPGATVLDLAAGTGKFTRLLVERGVRCVAVEPVSAMRRTLSKMSPQVWAFNGTAEDIPLETESVDGVVVAQAFHWFRADDALAEIHRVTKPGARLALVWNARDIRVDWVRRVTELIDPYGEGEVRVPRYRDAEVAWRPAMERTPLFAQVAEHEFAYEQRMTVEGLCERMASVSFIAALDDETRARVLDELRDLARTHPELAGRAEFAHPYVTEVYVYERR